MPNTRQLRREMERARVMNTQLQAYRQQLPEVERYVQVRYLDQDTLGGTYTYRDTLGTPLGEGEIVMVPVLDGQELATVVSTDRGSYSGPTREVLARHEHADVERTCLQCGEVLPSETHDMRAELRPLIDELRHMAPRSSNTMSAIARRELTDFVVRRLEEIGRA